MDINNVRPRGHGRMIGPPEEVTHLQRQRMIRKIKILYGQSAESLEQYIRDVVNAFWTTEQQLGEMKENQLYSETLKQALWTCFVNDKQELDDVVAQYNLTRVVAQYNLTRIGKLLPKPPFPFSS